MSARAHGISIHLLSYLQDPTHPALTAELDRTRDARLNRARAIVELLAVDVPITWDDVLAQSRDAVVVGRPHIADALVALGIVPGPGRRVRAPALAPRGPYHVPHYAPDGPDAVRAIRAAGGVPVFAHPGADARGRIVPDARVRPARRGRPRRASRWTTATTRPAQRERLTAIADRLGLLVTGSSDYHGAGKANRLGENLTAPEVLAAIEEQGTTDVVRP